MASPKSSVSFINEDGPTDSSTEESSDDTPSGSNVIPNNEEEERTPRPAFNPSLSDDEDNAHALIRIRGDAIGNTLYCERFVIKTLMKLSTLKNDLAEDEQFERDLCALWDMTIEEDVATYMLAFNILTLLSDVIDATQDRRLTEILVGIIANICSYAIGREHLKIPTCTAASTILKLIECSDTLILTQLMRFIAVAVDNPSIELMCANVSKSHQFLERYASILCNSINKPLLKVSLEALNIMLVKFSTIESLDFGRFFVKDCILEGISEAFKTIMPKNNSGSDEELNDNDDMISARDIQKTMQIYVYVLSLTVQYTDEVNLFVEYNVNEPLNCVGVILKHFTNRDFLIPISPYNSDILDEIKQIFKNLDYPFHEVCFRNLLTIWHLVTEHNETEMELLAVQPQQAQPEDGAQIAPMNFEPENDEVNESASSTKAVIPILLNILLRMIIKGTVKQLEKVFIYFPPTIITKFLNASIEACKRDEIFRESEIKIKCAIENLKKKTMKKQN